MKEREESRMAPKFLPWKVMPFTVWGSLREKQLGLQGWRRGGLTPWCQVALAVWSWSSGEKLDSFSIVDRWCEAVDLDEILQENQCKENVPPSKCLLLTACPHIPGSRSLSHWILERQWREVCDSLSLPVTSPTLRGKQCTCRLASCLPFSLIKSHESLL